MLGVAWDAVLKGYADDAIVHSGKRCKLRLEQIRFNAHCQDFCQLLLPSI